MTVLLAERALTGSVPRYTGPHSDVHHKLGLAIILLILVQAIFGIGAKLVKKPSFNYVTLQTKRHPLRLLHIAFGIATAAILCACSVHLVRLTSRG